MRKFILSVLFGLTILFNIGQAQAITIGFDPVSQTVPLGTPVDVSLRISGLGDYTAPSLSTFDLDVSFDPAILSFSSVIYGDPVLGDQLDLFGFGSITATTTGLGTVNLFELSFDLPFDLETLQPGSFILATLTFDTLAVGTSPLGLSINALGDAWGDPLSADIVGGSVSAVPEPMTILLLGSGLAGLVGLRRLRI